MTMFEKCFPGIYMPGLMNLPAVVIRYKIFDTIQLQVEIDTRNTRIESQIRALIRVHTDVRHSSGKLFLGV